MTWYQQFSWFEITLCCLFVLLYFFYIARIKKIASVFDQKANKVWWKLILRSSYFSLIIIALLGPSFGAMKKEIKTTGKEIYIAVDLSLSMNAKDIQPSRLERIKYELTRFVQNFQSDKTGLIIFSSQAFVQCPLTFDQGILQMYIQTLKTNLVPEGGTDFSAPLDLALSKFTNEEDSEGKKKAKIIILISDGEDFSDNLKPILKKLEEEKIRVFTLGIGTTEGDKIPFKKGFKRDFDGDIVISKLQNQKLKEVSNLTGGAYYEISEDENQLRELTRAINNIEGEIRETKEIDVTANKYFYPLTIALLLITIDFLTNLNIIKI